MKFRTRARDEKGAVLVIVAVSMLALMTLTAGGIMLFTLYGANREMQKAADQGALAAAAGLPLLNPGQTLDSLGLQQNYDLVAGVGLDTALHSAHKIPDPRAVGCAYASRNLQADSAHLVTTFGANMNAGGYCANDPRVNVIPEPLASSALQCLNSLAPAVTNLTNQLEGGLSALLSQPLVNLLGIPVGIVIDVISNPLLEPLLPSGLTRDMVIRLVNNVPHVVGQLDEVLKAVQNLEQLSPALTTPRVRVTVTERVSPPMLSVITGSTGLQMTVGATAERRLKNAIVLPGTPLLGVDLNEPLSASKDEIMGTLTTVNDELNGVITRLESLGLGSNLSGCKDLLGSSSKLYQDIDDLYNPPDSAPYTGRDLVEGAMDAVERVAANSGAGVDAIAGEAFLVIAEGGPNATTLQNVLGASVTTLGLSSTLNTLPIPALDVALVAAHHLENGNIGNEQLIPDTLSARGLFTARLVK